MWELPDPNLWGRIGFCNSCAIHIYICPRIAYELIIILDKNYNMLYILCLYYDYVSTVLHFYFCGYLYCWFLSNAKYLKLKCTDLYFNVHKLVYLTFDTFDLLRRNSTYWAALSLSFRLISIVNEHNSLGSPGKTRQAIRVADHPREQMHLDRYASPV